MKFGISVCWKALFLRNEEKGFHDSNETEVLEMSLEDNFELF